MNNVAVAPQSTGAFVAQAWISFGVSLGSVLVGIAYLPASHWIRAFLALGVLYTVTSSLVLAKTIRDQHEAGRLISRVDETRLERFLSEHDPFGAPTP